MMILKMFRSRVLAAALAAGMIAPAGIARQTEMEVARIEAALPADAEPLDAQEEAELEARDQTAGPEVKGGALSNLHLTYAVIALAAIVLVLVLK